MDSVKPRMSASCSFSDLTITLDFETHSANLAYNINPKHLEEAFAISPDGRYSLHTSSSDGGGDISYSNIVLRDGKNGKLRFLALSGGMYGGYNNIGFFSNGDIYVQRLDSLKVFSWIRKLLPPCSILLCPWAACPMKKLPVICSPFAAIRLPALI
jgi:hypothetical protein